MGSDADQIISLNCTCQLVLGRPVAMRTKIRSWPEYVALSHKRSVLAVDEFFELRYWGDLMKYIISGVVVGVVFYVIASGYLLIPGQFSLLIAHPGAALYALISHAWLWCAIGFCIVAPIGLSFIRVGDFNPLIEQNAALSKAHESQGTFGVLQDDYNNGVLLPILKARGCSISTLRELHKRGKPDERITITDFLEQGFSWRELIAGGYTAIEVLKVGASLKALKNLKHWGYSLEELLEAGFSIADLHRGGYTDADCSNVIDVTTRAFISRTFLAVQSFSSSPERLDCSVDNLKTLLLAGISVEALRENDVLAETLFLVGVSLEALKRGGYEADQLTALASQGCDSFMEDHNHAADDLQRSGYSEVEKLKGYFSVDECDQISKLNMNDMGLLTLFCMGKVMLGAYFFGLSWLAMGISLGILFIAIPFVCFLIGYCIEKIIEKVFLDVTIYAQQDPTKQGFFSHLLHLLKCSLNVAAMPIIVVLVSIVSVMKFEICVPLEMMIYHMLRSTIHVFQFLRTCIHFLVGWPFVNHDGQRIATLKEDYDCRQEKLQRHVEAPVVNEHSNLIYLGSSYRRHPIGGWLRIPLMSGLRSHAQAFMKAMLRFLLFPILAPLELLRILVPRFLVMCFVSIGTLRENLFEPKYLFHDSQTMITTLTFYPTTYKTELEELKALYAGTIKVPELDCNQPVTLEALKKKYIELSLKYHPDKALIQTPEDVEINTNKMALIAQANKRAQTKLTGDGFGLERLFRWFSIEHLWPQPLFERAESFLDKVYMQSSPHFFARACFYMFTLAIMSCAVLSFASVLVGPAVVSSTIVSMLSSLGALLSFPMNINLALPLASSMIYLSVFGVSMLLTLMSINYRLSSYGQVRAPHAKDASGLVPWYAEALQAWPALAPVYEQAATLRICDRPPAGQMSSTLPIESLPFRFNGE
jgi:hypothetical protein